MKLTIERRPEISKGVCKRIRREGDIPAVLYGSGRETLSITVRGAEFQACLRGVESGCLPTTIFETELDGQPLRAIVKGIQYHPTTYQIVHLDLAVVSEQGTIDVNVPVVFSGAALSPGIKLGGNLRAVLRHVKVRCQKGLVPQQFELDVGALQMREAKRVSDIVMPEGVRPLVSEKEVVVVIAKR